MFFYLIFILILIRIDVIMLTPFLSDLCRTEKYNVGEKMISWLGNRYGPMFVIVLVLFAAGWSGADPVTFLIMPRPDTFISKWGSTLAIPLLVITGILADKYGRLRFLALLALITVLIEGLFASFMVTMTYSIYLNVNYVTVAITGLALLMAYESVPLKYRLPALVGLSIPAALGSVLCDIVGSVINVNMSIDKNVDYEAMADQDHRATKDRIVLLIKQVIGITLMLSSFIAIVIVLRRQVGLWRIFNEASSKLYMTMIAQKGKQDTNFDDITCPVPVTRCEFVINISNETVRDSCWDIVKAARGPLVLLLTLSIAEGLSFNSLNMYEVMMEKEVYRPDFMGSDPRVTTTVLMIIASLVYIVLWYFHRDVRYVAFLGLILCAVSSFIALAAPIEVALDGDRVDTTVFTVGYIMATVGLFFASASLRLFVLDLMPTKMRGTGILTWVAVVNFSTDLIPLLGEAGWYGSGTEIFSAFFIGVSSILGLAAVYTTNWFKHSLVCRDPELDAQWLIKELSPANKFTYSSSP